MTDVPDAALEAATNAMNVAMQMEYGANFSADVLKRMARAALTAALPHLQEGLAVPAGFVAVPRAHAVVVTQIANRNEQSSSGDIMAALLAADPPQVEV